jgi:hypothetical protein
MPERTTLEAYASIIVAIAIALVTSWWMTAVLLLVLITLVIDISFHAPFTARLERRSRAMIALVSSGVVFVVGLRLLSGQYHVAASNESLVASFFIEMHESNTFDVEYSFFNQGGDGASVSALGLAAIRASNHVDEPAANANLCENAHPIRMLVTQMEVRLHASEAANEAVTSESYRPTRIMVDGQAWPIDRPIEIAAGTQRTFSATYMVGEAEAKFNVMALCPTLDAFDDAGLGGSVLCKGLLSVRSPAGLVAIRAAGRVRILPRTRDVLCPSAA